MFSFKMDQADADEYTLKMEGDETNITLFLDTHECVELFECVERQMASYVHEMRMAKHNFEAGLNAMGDAIADDPEDTMDAGYATDDPKHPEYHSTHAAVWDEREGK